MAAPDPDLCTPEEWDAYLASADVFAMTQGEADTHRGLLDRYTERLWRQSAAASANLNRLLDARDEANAEAEALSVRCRELSQEVFAAGEAVITALRNYGRDDPHVEAARAREAELTVELSRARAELATANLRAIQATKDAM
ncbi:hypothetical protein MUY14_26335 [Amycolatopsis sp. FBCC-B4732]|uniref:hypothetical protein n=1 Tax=Amycolatopsis sp. FBCC-B4732 TaxID=3079339 RepID=UPI001FF67E07|nr:hypothetical protein [Amycolatopsis sp. FBCC-B4732]UOX85310.1 hypothetical protein MUY14_26335 [Amycolatopsis sp. FBCC-B4732]